MLSHFPLAPCAIQYGWVLLPGVSQAFVQVLTRLNALVTCANYMVITESFHHDSFRSGLGNFRQMIGNRHVRGTPRAHELH